MSVIGDFRIYKAGLFFCFLSKLDVSNAGFFAFSI